MSEHNYEIAKQNLAAAIERVRQITLSITMSDEVQALRKSADEAYEEGRTKDARALEAKIRDAYSGHTERREARAEHRRASEAARKAAHEMFSKTE